MEQTFGGFVRQRRSSMGITLRGLAARGSVKEFSQIGLQALA